MSILTGSIRKMFGLRPELSIGFYCIDFIFRRILRQNAKVKWALHHTATIRCPQNLKVGKGSFPGDSPGVYIDATNRVTMGNYTNLGPNVGLISSGHDFINNEKIVVAAPLQIGSFCWFGMGSIMLPGKTIGDFTIVAAGAVISKDFPEGYCVIAGNPATIIKQLNKADCEAFAKSKI
jgi:acetyltransferase-like isoleucine patch superfamily enzyme